MKLYLCQTLTEKIAVDVLGATKEIPLTWAKGMFGAIPVFKTREDAEEYSGGKRIVSEVEVQEEE